jgi:hypothetical protein
MTQENSADHPAIGSLGEVWSSGVHQAGVIDLFAVDKKTGEVLLVMNESRPWDGSAFRLHELQEKFNAYVSFLLDGEMTEAHPELAGKPMRIELRCAQMLDDKAVALLGAIHDQLALQEIRVEVIVTEGGDRGSSCACTRIENQNSRG